ncbi:hypothetical protein HAPG_00035 [Halorubrum phage GNf2]|nr:hypothetical protein HAPG_00035 [Halorubrum phage GNf2]
MTVNNKRSRQVIYFADWNPTELNGDILPITKVGISINPQRRMKDLTLPPFGIDIVATFETVEQAKEVELELHKNFTKCNFSINGEWFKLPNEIIEWAERKNHVSISNVKEINWSKYRGQN